VSDYFDELDTQEPRLRHRAQFAKLSTHLQQAVQHCSGLATHLQGHDLTAIHDLNSLQTLPVLRKTALMEAQSAHPPFGGFVNEQALEGCRIFMSPGPVWEPQVGVIDPWESARALHAAGFRASHRVHNTFSYHVTPGGFILDEGARALGCSVFPAGTSSTEMQVQTMQTYRADAFVGTPDYLNTVLDKATEMSVQLPDLKFAMLSGGPLFPSLRDSFVQRGIAVSQCYATADLGVIAYETTTNGAVNSGMLLNEYLIVEIVKPGTGDAVDTGEVGEIVVTRLHPDYPLVRFATGDMSAFIDEPSPCGRTQQRIKGWMGRADQRTKVRGMFVDPVQVQKIRQTHPEIGSLRLIVSRENNKDQMTLKVVPKDQSGHVDKISIDALTDTLKQVTGLSGVVELETKSFPNDGIVVEDKRDIES